jgi:uncharacterized protein
MKNLLTIILTIVSFNLSAQKSLCYEVSGNGLNKPSYIFGTIHMICPNDFILKESVKSKFKESDQIVLEIDMDDPQMPKKMMEVASYKNGETIKSLLTDADYERLSMFFKDTLSMDLKMLERFKPVLLVSLLTSKMLPCTIKSYEGEFIKAAQEQKKEVLGLETIEFQMGIFDKISNEDMSKMLKSMIDDYPKMKTQFATMVEYATPNNLDRYDI